MNRRIWACIGAILCFSSLAIAYFYFQLAEGLPPCPLCILDRIIIGILGVVFVLLMLNVYFLTRLLGWLALLAGFAVGGRHVWLERFRDPSAAGDCAPGGAQSAIEWLTSAFIGTGDCSVIYWHHWGLSIADLTLILYLVLAVAFINCRKKEKQQRNIFS